MSDNVDDSISQIREKIARVADNVKKNLVEASSNVKRTFIIDEDDFLNLLLMSLRSIDSKSKHETKNSENNIDNTDNLNNIPNRLTDKEPTLDVLNKQDNKKKEEKSVKMKGGKVKTNEEIESKKMKKEIHRILNSQFNTDAKMVLLTDAFERRAKNINLQKERTLEARFRETYPNVMAGAGSGHTQNDVIRKKLTMTSSEDTAEQRETEVRESKEKERKKRKENIVNEKKKKKNEKENLQNDYHETKLNNAAKMIYRIMNHKINDIFLENLKFHKKILVNYFTHKMKKKRKLHLKGKHILNTMYPDNSIEIAKMLVYLSFSRAKIYKFLKYRDQKVTPMSKDEKNMLKIIKDECRIPLSRIPCKAIRAI